MPKTNKREYINKVKGKLPGLVRAKLDSLDNFFKHVVRERWYKLKFLGVVSLVRYIFRKKSDIRDEKRILAVGDLSVTGMALGAFLEFNSRLLCEAHANGITKVDFAVVYNPEKPVDHWKDASSINKDNFHLHFSELILVLTTNPLLGSVFVFNSHDEFERFLKINSNRYIMKPSFFNYVNKKAIGRGNFIFLKDFYTRYKFMPKLRVPNFESLYAKAIMKKHAKGKYVVAVNLRSNPFYDNERNATFTAWAELFQHCLKEHPDVVFVILGRKSEVSNILRGYANVVIAQDHNTNIQHTFAFIDQALLYLATSSGPASFAILGSEIPYVITSFTIPDISHNYGWIKPNVLLPWQNGEFQKIIWERETPQLLIKEFENLFAKVDKEKWLNNIDIDGVDESVLEWPYVTQKVKMIV